MSTILVVDDDPGIAGFLRIGLEAKGWHVVVRKSGIGIVDIVLGKTGVPKPDVLMLDHRLPGKTGVEIVEELAMEKDETPILLFSNDTTLGTLLAKLVHPRVRYAQKGKFTDLVQELEDMCAEYNVPMPTKSEETE